MPLAGSVNVQRNHWQSQPFSASSFQKNTGGSVVVDVDVDEDGMAASRTLDGGASLGVLRFRGILAVVSWWWIYVMNGDEVLM